MVRHGVDDNWAAGEAYEPYVGRWSRLVGNAFVDWLAEPPDKRWIDVGCGTGVLAQVALEHGLASRVVGVDSSEGLLAYARSRDPHPSVSFRPGAAESLPLPDNTFDVAVSGLVLNFLSDPAKGVTEMRRVVCPGGTVAAYVWDYAGGMQMMRHFWDAAIALNPSAKDLDEANRFPLAAPEPMLKLFEGAGLSEVESHEIEIPTIFEDFDDYWTPFLGGVGPAPAYCASLDEPSRSALRDRLEATLTLESDGRIHLTARAWAVRGTVPD
jgi:SAM-dependent methyltransferase